MDRISAAQLAEIENRANDATEGPWKLGEYIESATLRIAEAFDSADENFIIAARSDVPALIAEIRAAWGEAEAATRVLRDFAAEEGLGGTKKCVGGWNTGYICGFDDEGEPIRGFTDYCRYCAARALVGSEKGNEDG